MTQIGGSFGIARPTGVCAATGRAIEPGQRYVAALVERDESDDLERLDFSLEAWEGGRRPEPPLHLFGFWMATARSESECRRVLIGDEELIDLFEQLAEAEEPRQVAFRYILALILIRKRLLRYEGSRGACMRVRPRGVALPPELDGDGPPLIDVRDPGMDEQTIAEATEQLSLVMLGGEDA